MFQNHSLTNPNLPYQLLVNSIALVKPEKAAMIENMLINMAQSGRVGNKVKINNIIID